MTDDYPPHANFRTSFLQNGKLKEDKDNEE